ncbi:MAG: class I SAM-dependent methyltransferase [Ardenticatenales bacterium]
MIATTAPDITHDGERVSPDVPNVLFVAHLSIYRFAGAWTAGKRVLDAGCGTGYGAAWLADHGAAFVCGVDVDPAAVQHARASAGRACVTFEEADLAHIDDVPAPDGGWDVVVSSNALEHVWGVDGFLRGVWSRLAPDGTLVVAVPGVFDAASRVLQMANPYHLNIWSPEQWAHAIGLWFAEVTPYRHWLARADMVFDPAVDAAAVGLTEADFHFAPLGPTERRAPTLTHVFVATRPRPAADVPAAGAPLPFIDRSFSRRPPRLTPLPPDEARANVPAAVRRLPAKAIRMLRARGVAALLAEIRRSVLWRVRRRYALALLRPSERGR